MIPKKQKQSGFTLIELLVVVVIIGILASVAIPNFMGAQDKAKNSGVQANGHAVQMAIEQYAVDNSSYPAAMANLYSTSAYGSGFPRTPWGTIQASGGATIACSSVADVSPSQGVTPTSYGAGTVAVPTTKNHFGAMCYTVATDKYDLIGVGKLTGNAICGYHVKNY